MKKAMIEISERVMLLVDHTKFDVVSLMAFADLKDIDVIITDTPLSNKYAACCIDHGIEVIVANDA
jgi:DeoR/GlpR family transcriptional regulator of sugar metabolism